ncbi:MAG: hypothetical protein V3W19_15015 [Desulfatiglandales bacterium]
MSFAKRAKAISELRAILDRHGLPSWASFGRVEGFDPHTVWTVVHRHWGRTDSNPSGPLTLAILARLQNYKSNGDHDHGGPPENAEAHESNQASS